MEQHVRVSYGKGFAMAVLLEEVHEGVLKGWCKLRMSDGHECYMAKSAIQSGDTDYRSYLKNHWDEARGYLRTDCLEEFMKVFMRAYTEYKNKSYERESKCKERKGRNDQGDHQHGEHGMEGTGRVHAASVGHGTSASVSKGHKGEAGTGDRTGAIKAHAVQLSLFPDFVAVEAYKPKK